MVLWFRNVREGWASFSHVAAVRCGLWLQASEDATELDIRSTTAHGQQLRLTAGWELSWAVDQNIYMCFPHYGNLRETGLPTCGSAPS